MATNAYMRPQTAEERLAKDLLFRQCRAGRDAAREIAQRVQASHGFWDLEERKRARQAQNAPAAEWKRAEIMTLHKEQPDIAA